MAKKLYVGGLPYSVDENQLRELFEPYGAVDSVQLITDKFTGRSRGFGFVEFGDNEAALRAIDEVNGKELGGRSLVVNEAKPRESRQGGFGGGGGRRGGGGNERRGRDRNW